MHSLSLIQVYRYELIVSLQDVFIVKIQDDVRTVREGNLISQLALTSLPRL